MNLTQLKSKLNIASLQLTTSKKDGVDTDWMRHWDNDTRTAVSFHKELVNELKNNPAIDSLGIKTSTKNGSKGSYTHIVVVKYKPAEVTF